MKVVKERHGFVSHEQDLRGLTGNINPDVAPVCQLVVFRNQGQPIDDYLHKFGLEVKLEDHDTLTIPVKNAVEGEHQKNCIDLFLCALEISNTNKDFTAKLQFKNENQRLYQGQISFSEHTFQILAYKCGLDITNKIEQKDAHRITKELRQQTNPQAEAPQNV